MPSWEWDGAGGNGADSDGGDDGVPCDVARRAFPELTAEAFERDFNIPKLPVIVTNLTDGWPAQLWMEAQGSDDWMFLRVAQSLVRSLMRRAHALPPYDLQPGEPNTNPASLFGVAPFARGETLDNQYINLDAVGSAYRHPLLTGYTRPTLVQPSLLDTHQCFATHGDVADATAQQKAFYIHSRWALISSAGSGSSWHIDPWNTSAWNALLHGRKRWALYPPSVAGLPAGVASSSPKDFFGTVLPTLPTADRPMQCVLRAGETMFLPSGWWHAVLNLSPTIAITENRVDDANVKAVLEEMRSSDPASHSGKRAAEACRREARKPTPFDRGIYPRDCEQRVDSSAVASPEMMDCVRRLEACDA